MYRVGRALALFVCLSAPAAAGGENPDTLWMPEGYRLLSSEERRSLPAEELKGIGTRNMQLLEDAVKGMPASECEAVARALSDFAASHPLEAFQKQYVTMVQMRLLARSAEERVAPVREADRTRFEKLLAAQENETKGFPTDAESVEREAGSLEARIATGDARDLYLQALKPLRARPWNESIRVVFRRIVRADASRPWNTSLYDAALAFLHAREKESPAEGAWFSLEAFFRLVLRTEVAEARRLFAAAISKGSRDVESRIFPLLLAEMDGNSAEVRRLLPRAKEAWPAAADLDRVMFDSIDALPSELAVKARETFGKKYETAHPSDWSARLWSMEQSLVEAQMHALRRETAARDSLLQRLDRETAMLLELPLSALPEPDRCRLMAVRLRAVAELGRCEEAGAQIAAFERAASAAYGSLESPEQAEALSAQVRSVQGLCLLAKGLPLEAARTLAPCAGAGENFRSDCVGPLSEAAIALVRSGKVDEGAAIYRQIAASGQADELFAAIEAAAPGTLPKPTPRPTPNLPIF